MKHLRWAVLVGSLGASAVTGAQETAKPTPESKADEAKPADKPRSITIRKMEIDREVKELANAQRAVAKAQVEIRRAQTEAQKAQLSDQWARTHSLFGFQASPGQREPRKSAYTITRQITGTQSSGFAQAFGLEIVPADPALRAQLDLPATDGLVVVRVTAEGVADKAGIKKDDVIAKIENQPAREVAQALKVMSDRSEPKATIALFRRGKPVEVTLTKPEPPASQEPYYIGVALGPVDATLRSQLPDLPEGTGLVVTEVTPNSPAAKAEAKPYDIVVKLDEKPVKDNEGLIEQIQKAKGEPVRLTIVRGGASKTLTMSPERRPATLHIDVKYAETPTVKLDGLVKSLNLPAGVNADGFQFMVLPDGEKMNMTTAPLNFDLKALGQQNQPQLEKQIKDLSKQLEGLQKAIEAMNKTAKSRPSAEAKEDGKD